MYPKNGETMHTSAQERIEKLPEKAKAQTISRKILFLFFCEKRFDVAPNVK